MIDTGAEVTSLSEEDCRKVKGKGNLVMLSKLLRDLSNQPR